VLEKQTNPFFCRPFVKKRFFLKQKNPEPLGEIFFGETVVDIPIEPKVTQLWCFDFEIKSLAWKKQQKQKQQNRKKCDFVCRGKKNIGGGKFLIQFFRRQNRQNLQ
jgi:hypothetical protein